MAVMTEQVSGRHNDPAVHDRAFPRQISTTCARIAATRWPEKEPVDDLSQGVPLAILERAAWPEQLDDVAERLRLIATEPVFELVADRR